MVQVMLAFPPYASRNLPGRDQLLIEKLSARLYRAEKEDEDDEQIKKDIFRTNESSGELERLSEEDADSLKATIKDSDIFDLDLRNQTFSLSYVNPTGNPMGNEGDKTLVLKFSLDQLPNKEYITDYCHLVNRKRRNNERRWVRSIPPTS